MQILHTKCKIHLHRVVVFVSCFNKRTIIYTIWAPTNDTVPQFSEDICMWLCSWALTSSSGEGVGWLSINGSDIGSPVEGVDQSCLFNDGKKMYIPSQDSDIPIRWHYVAAPHWLGKIRTCNDISWFSLKRAQLLACVCLRLACQTSSYLLLTISPWRAFIPGELPWWGN